MSASEEEKSTAVMKTLVREEASCIDEWQRQATALACGLLGLRTRALVEEGEPLLHSSWELVET